MVASRSDRNEALVHSMEAKPKCKLSDSQVDAIARLLLSLPPIESSAEQAKELEAATH
jgi:hypothetical protein